MSLLRWSLETLFSLYGFTSRPSRRRMRRLGMGGGYSPLRSR